jgi:2-polyprenyl-3-methyl-5-hydroxy-6-metoxy-1,4-benzoquinol methylase
MRIELLDILRCPESGQPLRLEEAAWRGDRIASGWLTTGDRRHRYPVRDFVPRFVPESNYADNFGMQWNKFRNTQLDSHTGVPVSTNRFWAATAWPREALRDQWVLDAGCGAGRFAEVSAGTGGKVVALDYSSAVDAARSNLERFPNLHVVQGDIYKLPFARRTFPWVYSLGVLQHTPDVAAAFASLPPMVSPGGRLCVDFYQRSWASQIQPKAWLRPITKRIPQPQLFRFLESAVPMLFPISRALGRIPVIGGGLRRMVPVANYVGILPLSDQQHLEWSLLDTFDWYAPAYDNPQTPPTVRRWLEAAGLADIEVLKAGHLVGRGSVPMNASSR